MQLSTIKLLFIFALSITGLINASAQQFKLMGKVFSSGETKEPIYNAAIINKTANDKATTDSNGNYILYVSPGDSVQYSHEGFFAYTTVIGNIKNTINKNVTLTKKSVVLQTAVVSGLTKYQRDSISTASLVEKAINYEQTASIMNPITSLYQQFSKKYQDLRKFQQQIVDMEKQKYIDTKYTYELVNAITKLEGDSAAYFMNAYPMEYNFARTSGQTEIKLWISYNFKQYKQKGLPANKVEAIIDSKEKK
jgi:hypothetical protein